VTGQPPFDGYEFAGVVTAAELVNSLALERAFGRPVEVEAPLAAIGRILAADPTWPAVVEGDAPGFVALASTLRGIFDGVHRGDLDDVARRLNALLAAHPAHPHLAKDDGVWHLHHHPVDAEAVPMATAICAEALARVVGAGGAERLGTCGAPECDRVFLDSSKNASRRFCSTTCQNRVKAAAFRRRRATADGPEARR
jgi:predicted RNA-binding Zn ribbon-like protein